MEETVYCQNCHSDIATSKWSLHEISCARHRWYCEACQETFPRQERDKHNKSYHTLVSCDCGEKIEARGVSEHQTKYCQRRMIACRYCEYPTFFCELREHEIDCGSRTEPCEVCGKRVQLAEQWAHDCDALRPQRARRTPQDTLSSRDLFTTTNEIDVATKEPDDVCIPTPLSFADDLVICPFCMYPAADYTLLQEHIFSEHLHEFHDLKI